MTTKMDPITRTLSVVLYRWPEMAAEVAWWRAYAAKHGYTLHLTVA